MTPYVANTMEPSAFAINAPEDRQRDLPGSDTLTVDGA